MKLDHDFVRSVLLKIEACNNPGGIEKEQYRELMDDNNKSFNELAYTIQILIEFYGETTAHLIFSLQT